MPPGSEPTAAYPVHHPWGATPAADPAPPTTDPSAPTTRFPAPPAPMSGLPATAQFAALPAQFSAPPAQFSAPPAPQSGPPAGPFSVPPARFAASPAVDRPGPHPPAFVPVQPPMPPMPPTQRALLPAGHHTPGQDAVAVQIAEIVVTPPVIRTPAGALPVQGAVWEIADDWQTHTRMAQWGIVLAIVLFCFTGGLSLLFLLARTTYHTGTVQVTVRHGQRQYVARIPVQHQGEVQQINNQVNYARSLSTF
ncbi:hypothetical protein [Micromonospora halophytica]|nr:hypothetical protein [Micromonospora halophytica]